MTKKDKFTMGKCKICGEFTGLKNGVCGRTKCILIYNDKKYPEFLEKLIKK